MVRDRASRESYSTGKHDFERDKMDKLDDVFGCQAYYTYLMKSEDDAPGSQWALLMEQVSLTGVTMLVMTGKEGMGMALENWQLTPSNSCVYSNPGGPYVVDMTDKADKVEVYLAAVASRMQSIEFPAAEDLTRTCVK